MQPRIGSLAALLAAACAPAPAPPNVVFVLVDDLGWSDLACYGNPRHETPHIDRLAREGTRFTQAYSAAPNCSPARASILTGQWPARLGITHYLPGSAPEDAPLVTPSLPAGLDPGDTTTADALREAGYATAAIGKWHLGDDTHLPAHQGFDLAFGGGAFGGHGSMFAPYGSPAVPNAKPGEYLTDRLTRKAERFLEEHRDEPFFLYLSLYAVHEPIEGKPELVAKYAERDTGAVSSSPEYAAMVEGVDACIGRLTAKLAELGLDERTLFVFFSDNGGDEKHTTNEPLRGGKGWLYEGGLRVPMIVRGAGFPAGKECATPVTSVDFHPTFLELAQLPPAGTDGRSLLALRAPDGRFEREALYWHFPHYSHAGGRPSGAIRRGDLKLIEYFEDGRLELFDLDRDPNERRDLAQRRPEPARELRAELETWRLSVGAAMPRRR